MNDFDGDYNDDPDWEHDLESDGDLYFDNTNPFEERAQEIAFNYGIQDWDEIIVDFSKVGPGELRGDRFSTLEEAVVFLFDLGVLEFGGVVYYQDVDLYGVAIDSDTGSANRGK